MLNFFIICIFNQESTSKFYSLKIYLEPGIILYERKYKKILTIFFEVLPIVYIVFIIIENFFMLFKLPEQNKILIKLLFENQKGGTRNKTDKKLNIIKGKNSKNHEPMTPFRNRNIRSNVNLFKFHDNSPSINNIKKEFSSINDILGVSYKENNVLPSAISSVE